MNVTPTSGPIAASSTHHARDEVSSRVSLRNSHRKATAELDEFAENRSLSAPSADAIRLRGLCASGEGKEDLFEIVARGAAARLGRRRQLLQRSFAARAAAAQQHEPVADARGVADLVNRQEHGPS